MSNLTEFSDLLAATASELDISDELHEAATQKYEEVGIWLAAEGSSLADYSPDIYPQGSFRLGTVVKPIEANCDYDIDLVCVLEREKESVTQNELKSMIGRRLRENTEYARLISPSRRCWNLSFPKQFHMDVLPSLPNPLKTPNGILLTDTELRFWQRSNPIDYANWFYDSMRQQVLEFRDSLAKSLSMSIEDVPEWQVKTPLQRAIQLLKRHRDIKFRNDTENRPVSIILTTLAAQAYRGEASVYDALRRLAADMPSFIEAHDGKYYVPNPVEPDENFADKWNEKPARRDAFLAWLGSVRSDFEDAASAWGIDEAAFRLKRNLQTNEVDSARAKLRGGNASLLEFAGRPVKPTVSSAIHSQPPTWTVSNRYKASIKATLHYTRNGRKLSALAARKVAKKLWIRFTLETNAPKPYKIFWKVVNTGAEAKAAGQLRGTIFPDTSSQGNVLWEHTGYSGTHWVEAYVVQGEVCTAVSAPKYVLVK